MRGFALNQLTVISCAMGGNQANIDFLRPIVAKLGMKLVTISEWDEHDIKWTHSTWLAELNKADIVVCVQRHTLQPAKSNNRVTQAQYLGKPVCASPLRAYTEAIKDGETGFICDTPAEWEEKLILLRDNIILRNSMGRAARESAKYLYSIDAVGSHWLNLLKNLAKDAGNPPKVDIIIPTWNNLKYLQECIKSIRANTDWPYNIIVVNSGTDGTAAWLSQQSDIIHHTAPDRLHFSAANNIGLKIGKSPYVCLLNDDTIVARYWLTAMMHEATKPGIGAVNPFSNCDQGWLHNEQWVVDGVPLHPGMDFDSVARIIPQIYTQKHPKRLTQREWVAFFCTVLPREAVDKVGLFDENFKSGCEDLDYCKRLAELGYRFVTTDDSVVFHFGGSTRKNAEKISHEIHHAEDKINHQYLTTKHGERALVVNPIAVRATERPVFVLYTGPGWEKWSPKSLEVGGIGGSETCAVHVAKEFAKRGYESIVYGDPGADVGMHDGVMYLPHEQFQHGRPMDILVSSRRPDLFQHPVNARKKVCWVHDIFVHHDPAANIFSDSIDKFFVLSPWHRDFFCNHHRISVSKTYLTRNGVDLSRFNAPVQKVRGRMIYSSSPDRGLDVLLDCMPMIRARVPEAHLKVFYGFANWKLAIQTRNNPHELAWMQQIEKRLHQPGVEYVGRINQNQLANEFMQAELWAYPTAFTETSCITAMEAMASGTPIITSNLAALATTVGLDGGILLDGDNKSEAYRGVFVEVCTQALTNYNLWLELSMRGKRKAANLGWSAVVDEWIKELR